MYMQNTLMRMLDAWDYLSLTGMLTCKRINVSPLDLKLEPHAMNMLKWLAAHTVTPCCEKK